MSSPTSTFIPGISLIRIILCLMICAFHWVRCSPVAGSVGVDWFIVLSGFLMMFTLKEESFSPPSFYISKFARLWPLLFTAFLLSFLVSYRDQFQLNNLLNVLLVSVGGNQFVHLHTGDNYALWYMKLEILFVILFPLVAYARKYLPVLLILGFAGAVVCTFLEPGAKLYFSFPYRLWQFLAGCYAAHLYKRHECFFRWSPAMFFLGLLYLLYQTFPGTSWGTGKEISSLRFLLPDTLIAAMTISSACSLVKSSHTPSVKIPAPLIHLTNRASLLTYAIFLVHVPLLQFMEQAWPGNPDGAHSVFFWISAILLLIAVGIVLHYGIEQPCGKWISSHLGRAFSKIRSIKYTCN